MTSNSNEPTRQDLMELAALLRQERPQPTVLQLDQMKTRVLRRGPAVRRAPLSTQVRTRLAVLSVLLVMFAVNVSSAAASALSALLGTSGGFFGIRPPGSHDNALAGGGSNASGTQYVFATMTNSWGGHNSRTDHHADTDEYCPDDQGSDDRDRSSSDDSDRDKNGYDTWKKSGSHGYAGAGWRHKGSDDNDSSSMDDSDRNGGRCDPPPPPCSDDHDGSSGDDSDGDKAGYDKWKKSKSKAAAGSGWSNKGSDDNDGSSDDFSDNSDRCSDNSTDSSDHHGGGGPKGSDDHDGSSGDDSDSDKASHDKWKKSGSKGTAGKGWSNKGSDDHDGSSDDRSD